VNPYSKGLIVNNSELYCAVCNEQHEGDQQVICTCGCKDRIVEREMARERDVRASVRMVISAVGVLVLALRQRPVPLFVNGVVWGMPLRMSLQKQKILRPFE